MKRNMTSTNANTDVKQHTNWMQMNQEIDEKERKSRVDQSCYRALHYHDKIGTRRENRDEDGMRNNFRIKRGGCTRGWDQKRTKIERIQEKKVVGHLTWVISNIAQGQLYEFRKESQ